MRSTIDDLRLTERAKAVNRKSRIAGSKAGTGNREKLKQKIQKPEAMIASGFFCSSSRIPARGEGGTSAHWRDLILKLNQNQILRHFIPQNDTSRFPPLILHFLLPAALLFGLFDSRFTSCPKRIVPSRLSRGSDWACPSACLEGTIYDLCFFV